MPCALGVGSALFRALVLATSPKSARQPWSDFMPRASHLFVWCCQESLCKSKLPYVLKNWPSEGCARERRSRIRHVSPLAVLRAESAWDREVSHPDAWKKGGRVFLLGSDLERTAGHSAAPSVGAAVIGETQKQSTDARVRRLADWYSLRFHS